MHTRHPAGMTVPDGVPTPTPGAVVHAWRPGHWYGHTLTLTLTLTLPLTLTLTLTLTRTLTLTLNI